MVAWRAARAMAWVLPSQPGGSSVTWRARSWFGVLGGDGVDDGAGRIGGAVVDGDDLEVGVVLREERVESGGDVGGLVASGDDDGDGGIACRGERLYSGRSRLGTRGRPMAAAMTFQIQMRATSQAMSWTARIMQRRTGSDACSGGA